jgi:hypothetical protein
MLVHRDPARNWTVASTRDGGWMSRSAFAARFSQLVGEPAVRYVTRAITTCAARRTSRR